MLNSHVIVLIFVIHYVGIKKQWKLCYNKLTILLFYWYFIYYLLKYVDFNLDPWPYVQIYYSISVHTKMSLDSDISLNAKLTRKIEKKNDLSVINKKNVTHFVKEKKYLKLNKD